MPDLPRRPARSPSALSSLFAPQVRWGWQLELPSVTPPSELQRNPPKPTPGEDYRLVYQRWKTEIEASRAATAQAPELTWNARRPDCQYSMAAIFGGTTVGWDALVVTLGGSTLGSGSLLTVINVSERPVTRSLRRLAALHGYDLRADTVTPQKATMDLYGYFGGVGLVDFIVDVLHADDEGSVNDARDDRAVLRAIADHLSRKVTARRLRAGLRVILRESEREDDHLRLSAEERTALGTRFGDERRQHTELISRAVRLEDAMREFVALEDSAALTVPETESSAEQLRVIEVVRDTTTYDFEQSRRLVIQASLRRMRNRAKHADAPPEDVLILGADQLRTATIDALSDLADGTAMRVTLVFAHLRGDAIDALGTARTAVAFMRLTDHREAAEASNYIGKDEKIVIGQQTRSRSENYARQTGTNRSEGTGQSRSRGPDFGTTIGSNTSLTVGTQNSDTRGETITLSRTDQRVIEPVVEPHVLQSLPETGLLLVNLETRKPVFADCDPTLVTIDQ